MTSTGLCFAKSKELVTREVAGERIIVPIKGHVGDLGSIYTLNEVGTMIWQLIDGDTSLSQIVDAVTGEYDIGEAEAKKDVVDFLNSLEAAGLIQQQPAHSA